MEGSSQSDLPLWFLDDLLAESHTIEPQKKQCDKAMDRCKNGYYKTRGVYSKEYYDLILEDKLATMYC